MQWPLSDTELAAWAGEHLVYEGRMLAFAAVRLAERDGLPPAPDSNALLECFIVHVRCLHDFLWHHRRVDQPMDAFAGDFCADGEWEASRPPVPPALTAVRNRHRPGREMAHLSYHRGTIDAESKAWKVGELYEEIAHALATLTTVALPSRLDEATRAALADLTAHTPTVGTPSVATGATYGVAIASGGFGYGLEHGS